MWALVALGTPWEVLRADLLERVYSVPIVVQSHPHSAAPLVLALPDRLQTTITLVKEESHR